MKTLNITPNLSRNATIMLLSFLDEISVEMRSFINDKVLSPESRGAVGNCWVVLKHLTLHTSVKVGIDRGINSDYYDKEFKDLDLLDEERKALFWSFMFRGTEYMLQKIKSPQYVANPSYVEVKKQLLEWNKFTQLQYQPFRQVLKSLKPVDSQSCSYTESGSFVPNLSQATN